MKPQPKFEIFRALKTIGRTQRWLAQVSGIHETSLSLIVNGRLIPNKRQMSAIAGALGIDPQTLFS